MHFPSSSLGGARSGPPLAQSLPSVSEIITKFQLQTPAALVPLAGVPRADLLRGRFREFKVRAKSTHFDLWSDLEDASLQPWTPETTLAEGSITFRGASVSLFNSGSVIRGFGADGHAWVFDRPGPEPDTTTTLTSNITARGCELDRTRWCSVDADCGSGFHCTGNLCVAS